MTNVLVAARQIAVWLVTRKTGGSSFTPAPESTVPANALSWRGQPVTWRGEVLVWR